MTSENFVNIGPDDSLFWLVNSGVLWHSYESNFTPGTKDQIVGWVSKLQSYLTDWSLDKWPGCKTLHFDLNVKICIGLVNDKAPNRWKAII